MLFIEKQPECSSALQCNGRLDCQKLSVRRPLKAEACNEYSQAQNNRDLISLGVGESKFISHVPEKLVSGSSFLTQIYQIGMERQAILSVRYGCLACNQWRQIRPTRGRDAVTILAYVTGRHFLFMVGNFFQ